MKKLIIVLVCLSVMLGILVFFYKTFKMNREIVIDRKTKEGKEILNSFPVLCPEVTAKDGEMVVLRFKESKYIGIESRKEGGLRRYKIYKLAKREDGSIEKNCIKTGVIRKNILEHIYTHGISINPSKNSITVRILYHGYGSAEIGLLGNRELTKKALEEIKYKKAVDMKKLEDKLSKSMEKILKSSGLFKEGNLRNRRLSAKIAKINRFCVPIKNGETGIVKYSKHEYLFVVPHKDNRWEGRYEVYFYDSKKRSIVKKIKKGNLRSGVIAGKYRIGICSVKPGEYIGEPDEVYLRVFPLDNDIKFGIYKGVDISRIDLKKIKFFDAGL